MRSITYAEQNATRTREDAAFRSSILEGLKSTPKYILSKYLYDERGSRLFEEITELPEYYQTRTEASILREYAEDIRGFFEKSTTLVELGSGSSAKTRILLDSMEQINAYIPIDISAKFLNQTVHQLSEDYPGIEVTGVSADYTEPFSLPAFNTKQKVVFFPGSTIGNFEPEAAVNFLRHIRLMLTPGDRMIMGMDRKKKRSVIEAAYNDEAGVTEAFNKNLLTRINRELKTGLNEQAFTHLSYYNDRQGRIEMHLKCEEDQVVKINDETIFFNQGETIHTENSYKFDLEDIRLLSTESGFTLQKIISDKNEYFTCCILEVPEV